MRQDDRASIAHTRHKEVEDSGNNMGAIIQGNNGCLDTGWRAKAAAHPALPFTRRIERWAQLSPKEKDMSSKVDYLKTYFAEVRDRGLSMELSEKHLSADFKSLDKDGNATMDRAAYIGFGNLLLSSFKDMKFIYSDIRDEGEDVVVTSHWEGTFTGDLDLSAMGMGVIPANGKKIVWPESSSKWKIEGDKIASIQDFSTGGIAEFLAPLGVKLPTG
jgi:hypothetical protein